jgi:hypothetical protein
MNDELRTIDLKLAEMRQAEARFNEAETALQKFYAKGPQQKKKSGRPPFWKSFHGLFFVKEVDDIVKEKNCKITFAIQILKKKRWRALDSVSAATLAKQKDDELPVRYTEARKFWSFLLNPEAYQKEEESLRRNLREAATVWAEAATALKYLVRTSLVRIGARNPYDFS